MFLAKTRKSPSYAANMGRFDEFNNVMLKRLFFHFKIELTKDTRGSERIKDTMTGKFLACKRRRAL